MTKYFHIVFTYPIERGWPNTYKPVDNKEFETWTEAEEFIIAYNRKPALNRHGLTTVAVYVGCVNDETGELV